MSDSRACVACGKPLQKKEDFAGGDERCDFCNFCASPEGVIKNCQEIFNGGVHFFMETIKIDRDAAERTTRKYLRGLAYWKGDTSECLRGEIASDNEFAAVLKQLENREEG